jgi:Rrf2 family transcriptional regulator, iron-sulfur cluster assembly transcription factor
VKLSTQIRYGVRSLCDIAYNSAGSVAQIKDISERQSISPRYIEQIFQRLKKAGIIKSVRGPAGGYYLSRRPEEISVGDVIRAVDGKSIQLVVCSGQKKGVKRACQWYGRCPTADVWTEASSRLMEYFDSITINSICEHARTRGIGI